MIAFKLFAAGLAGCSLALLASPASAHVSLAGPGFAGKNQVLTFSTGHGCEGADTVAIQVHIPAAVTSLRALPSAFGDALLTKNETGQVTAVTWTKTTPPLAADEQYYQHQIRVRVPDMAFSTLYFPVTQTCRTPEGVESTVEWAALPGEDGEPSPSLTIMPARMPGWNQFTVPAALADLAMFDDAQIVWSGEAAYSANPTTMALIRAEDDVAELTAIEAGATIWVKY